MKALCVPSARKGLRKSGKGAGGFYSKMVIKHFDLDVSAGDATVTVVDGVYNQFSPTEFREQKIVEALNTRLFQNKTFFRKDAYTKLIQIKKILNRHSKYDMLHLVFYACRR